jgi:hypothetical protein
MSPGSSEVLARWRRGNGSCPALRENHRDLFDWVKLAARQVNLRAFKRKFSSDCASEHRNRRRKRLRFCLLEAFATSVGGG